MLIHSSITEETIQQDLMFLLLLELSAFEFLSLMPPTASDVLPLFSLYSLKSIHMSLSLLLPLLDGRQGTKREINPHRGDKEPAPPPSPRPRFFYSFRSFPALSPVAIAWLLSSFSFCRWDRAFSKGS